jgi:hypothetical protein
MNTSTACRLSFLLIVGSFAVGCDQDAPPKQENKSKPPPATKKAKIAQNVFLETAGDRRRVVIEAAVCLRKGQLEQLLTRKLTKEHEAILAFDGDARSIHAGLIAAGAEPGKPVQFRPKYRPASGTPIKVTLRYEEKGKTIEVPAQKWVKHIKTGKDLEHNWVFGGSHLIPDPLDQTKQPFYAANDGDVICLSNFETAMLDLPISSSTDNDDLFFEANTDRIPAMESRVWVVLEPIREKKK